jgi:hypothetical protein
MTGPYSGVLDQTIADLLSDTYHCSEAFPISQAIE